MIIFTILVVRLVSERSGAARTIIGGGGGGGRIFIYVPSA